jgi:hypothetical protein
MIFLCDTTHLSQILLRRRNRLCVIYLIGNELDTPKISTQKSVITQENVLIDFGQSLLFALTFPLFFFSKYIADFCLFVCLFVFRSSSSFLIL